MSAKHYLYRNLHTGTFSLKFKGKVIAHPSILIMRDVLFKVSAKGRARVLASKRKNVHATVAGTPSLLPYTYTQEEVYYNPYKTATFINKATGIPVLSADLVLCQDNKIYILKEQ